MKTVMELISTAGLILDRANKLIYDHENKVEMIFGFPIRYCPDELLKKFIKAQDKITICDPAYNSYGRRLANEELELRAKRGIKIIQEVK